MEGELELEFKFDGELTPVDKACAVRVRQKQARLSRQ